MSIAKNLSPKCLDDGGNCWFARREKAKTATNLAGLKRPLATPASKSSTTASAKSVRAPNAGPPQTGERPNIKNVCVAGSAFIVYFSGSTANPLTIDPESMS